MAKHGIAGMGAPMQDARMPTRLTSNESPFLPRHWSRLGMFPWHTYYILFLLGGCSKLSWPTKSLVRTICRQRFL